MAKTFSVGRFRTRPRAGKGYEWRVTDEQGRTLAACRNPEDASLVYRALIAYFPPSPDRENERVRDSKGQR